MHGFNVIAPTVCATSLSLLTSYYQIHVCVTDPEIIFQYIHAERQLEKGVLEPLACHSAPMCV